MPPSSSTRPRSAPGRIRAAPRDPSTGPRCTAFSGSCSFEATRLLPGQLVQEPVGEFVEVVQAVAQIGVGLPHQLGARVALHALDGGFGREPGRHGLAQPPQPAAVVGDHPKGLQDLAMLAGTGLLAAVDQPVDRPRAAPRSPRRAAPISPSMFSATILRHDDARLVQHHVAEPDPLGRRPCP